jgi:seipin
MLDVALVAPESQSAIPLQLISAPLFIPANGSTSILGHSRRPAILTYSSPLVNLVHTVSRLPLYLLGWKKDSEKIDVVMFEGVQFAKGWRNVPDRIQVSVEADEKMQFYEVIVKVKARFQGLRYVVIYKLYI